MMISFENSVSHVVVNEMSSLFVASVYGTVNYGKNLAIKVR